MQDHYRFYRAEGKSLEIVRDFQEKMKVRTGEIMALVHEVGARSAVTRFHVAGFIFDGDPPEGWKDKGPVHGTQERYHAPEKRKKADKDLWKRMKALRPLSGSDFASAIGAPGRGFIGGPGPSPSSFRVLYPVFETVGDVVVIHVPDVEEAADFVPEDAVLMKNSEYWALKEAHEAA